MQEGNLCEAHGDLKCGLPPDMSRGARGLSEAALCLQRKCLAADLGSALGHPLSTVVLQGSEVLGWAFVLCTHMHTHTLR